MLAFYPLLKNNVLPLPEGEIKEGVGGLRGLLSYSATPIMS